MLLYCGKSDVGMRRKINQDIYGAMPIWDDDGLLLIVCDGMGGHKAGDTASRTAMEAFRSVVVSRPCTAEDPIIRSDNIKNTLVAAVKEANEAVYRLAQSSEAYTGMGTTLVAAIISRGMLYAVNIGDSRLYIVTRHEAKQITRDHSFVQFLVQTGQLTPEEAKNSPRKNVITRAVGVASKTEVDFFNINLRKWGSGYILLCTDGLTNYLDDKILFELLFQSRDKVRPTPQEELAKKADTLVAYANQSGGSDNITVLLAKF
ncbi:MAG: Stp1/IreP family PP2C-type Ser/Thr phosphatase [Clostridia bacterium]|nr:Stp1/IreP family PP2C-type Ser/Thr phosphatase [Clostridia bacterium]